MTTRAVTLTACGSSVTLSGLAAEMAVLLALHQEKFNDASSGRVELHFGDDGVSLELHARLGSQKRARDLTQRAPTVTR